MKRYKNLFGFMREYTNGPWIKAVDHHAAIDLSQSYYGGKINRLENEITVYKENVRELGVIAAERMEDVESKSLEIEKLQCEIGELTDKLQTAEVESVVFSVAVVVLVIILAVVV